MQFFERMNAKTKILLGFLLMAVFIFAMGYIGMRSAQVSNNDVQSLYHRDFQGSARMRDAEVTGYVISLAAHKVVLAKDQNTVRELQRAIEHSNETLREHLGRALTPRWRRMNDATYSWLRVRWIVTWSPSDRASN